MFIYKILNAESLVYNYGKIIIKRYSNKSKGIIKENAIDVPQNFTYRTKNMENSNPFRIAVLRWLSEPDLFEEDHYNYHVIATNLECSKEEVIYEYNKRVNIENIIKELKIGIGMENLPTGDYFANSLFFAIGVLVYNTFIIMKTHLLPEEYGTKTIDTFRWSVINIAGKAVRHGRNLFLLLACKVDKLKLYQKMRDRCAVFV